MKYANAGKRALALALCFGMMPTAVYAADQTEEKKQIVTIQSAYEIPVQQQNVPKERLTYNDALKRARESSNDLVSLQKNAEVADENRQSLLNQFYNASDNQQYELSGSIWKAIEGLDFSNSLVEYQEGIYENALELTLKSYFAAIVNDTASLELAEKNLEIQQELLEQGQKKYELGVISQRELNDLESAVTKADLSAQMARLLIEQDYMNLNRLMGEDDLKQQYALEYELDVDPIEVPYGELDAYVESALRSDYSLKISKKTIQYNKDQEFYGADVTDTRTAQNTTEQSERDYEAAVADKELAIRKAYLSILQLESSMDTARQSLADAQRTLEIAKLNLAAGNVTPITVTQAELAVTQAQNALTELEFNHDMLLYQFDHTSLLGGSAN